MKLLTFEKDGFESYGPKVKREEAVWDILKIAVAHNKEDFPKTIREGVAKGNEFVEAIRSLVERAEKSDNPSEYKHAFNEITWKAPIPKTAKNIMCVGKNYADHAVEMGEGKAPEKIVIFTKAPTTIAADEQTISAHADVTEELDYEAELAIVIGKRGHQIPRQLAYDYVFGYTIANDISARDIQYSHQQYFLGKSLNETCPLGPYVVTKDEIPNPHNLSVVTKVNDEIRQNGHTSNMIFKVEDIIAEISRYVTLEPGDIILTGTPAGVGKGMNPPQFLKAGDEVKISIEDIGTLTNRFQ
ncbi:fumarylacetoacetate hydrolase family protein [Savagea sp. SN6]|uniref:Fumarylacetoacetate hydrolase family protein n=1 Tax=Savagea serpentis TaxID=2785297 RepID=A0A8J7G4B7_9BACL|nr:fumarylacetoacetate hydrolase family protein [Savagea serpentis]MBF4502000.1 fumarylacetoacetate hydrolase family protein [Savagea serpentis]